MNEIPLSILFLSLGFTILLSAFFSSAETGMIALNHHRLQHLLRDKHRAAQRVAQLLKRKDRLIGLILLGNNLVNIIAATIATIIGLRLAGDLGVALAPFILVVIFLIFAEVVPKTAAALHPESFAFPFSLPLTILLKLFYPLVYLINITSNNILALFSLNPEIQDKQTLSREELHSIVHEASLQIPRNYQRMLLNILELEDVTVEDIMVPRGEMQILNLQDPSQQIINNIQRAQYAQIPVCDGDLDNIIGVLSVRRLLKYFSVNIDEEEVIPRPILTEPYFIPKGSSLYEQLLIFQERKERLGVVVDEYGTILGLITLVDILEEIVGEFITNSQNYSQDIQPQEENIWLIDGSTTLRDINRRLQWQLPTENAKTLNGLIMEHLEHIPSAGTSLRIGEYTIEITKVADNSVKKVRMSHSSAQSQSVSSQNGMTNTSDNDTQ